MYRPELAPPAVKQFHALEKVDQRRVAAKFEALKINPHPPGSKKLAGLDDLYRVRVGNYRIVYQIHEKILRVLVLALGHRRDVYRKL